MINPESVGEVLGLISDKVRETDPKKVDIEFRRGVKEIEPVNGMQAFDVGEGMTITIKLNGGAVDSYRDGSEVKPKQE